MNVVSWKRLVPDFRLSCSIYGNTFGSNKLKVLSTVHGHSAWQIFEHGSIFLHKNLRSIGDPHPHIQDMVRYYTRNTFIFSRHCGYYHSIITYFSYYSYHTSKYLKSYFLIGFLGLWAFMWCSVTIFYLIIYVL